MRKRCCILPHVLGKKNKLVGNIAFCNKTTTLQGVRQGQQDHAQDRTQDRNTSFGCVNLLHALPPLLSCFAWTCGRSGQRNSGQRHSGQRRSGWPKCPNVQKSFRPVALVGTFSPCTVTPPHHAEIVTIRCVLAVMVEEAAAVFCELLCVCDVPVRENLSYRPISF